MNTDEAFAAHYRRLTNLARRLVDRQTAEEVAADAIARLPGSSVTEESAEVVAMWLNRVTVNAALNRLRSRRRERRRVAAHGAVAMPTAEDTPEDLVGRDDEQRRVRDVLAQLPDRQATALLLRHAGHSYAEVAMALGVADGSVGVLLARGERAFRRLWDDPDHADNLDPSEDQHSEDGATR